jgi:hypothetical protein
MKLLVKILLSLCSFLLGVHAHTSLQNAHGFPKHFYTLSAGDLDNLQDTRAIVSQRRSSGDRRTNDEVAEKEEESDDDDDESKSSKRHTGPGSNYISYSASGNINSLYFLSHFSASGHLSHFSADKFIIHCVFRI